MKFTNSYLIWGLDWNQWPPQAKHRVRQILEELQQTKMKSFQLLFCYFSTQNASNCEKMK